MKTILLVDDEYAIVEVLTGILEDEGYAVLVAGNGREALERMAETKPDLVLLDRMMPALDGEGTLAAMREDPRLASVPVVLMSATALERGTELDARTRFLRKPFHVDDLIDTIAALIAASAPVAG